MAQSHKVAAAVSEAERKRAAALAAAGGRLVTSRAADVRAPRQARKKL